MIIVQFLFLRLALGDCPKFPHCKSCGENGEGSTCDHDQCVTGYKGDTCSECDADNGYKQTSSEPLTCVLACTTISHCNFCGAGSTCDAGQCETGYKGDICNECDTDNGYKQASEASQPLTCVLACTTISHCNFCGAGGDGSKCDANQCETGYKGDTCNECDTDYEKLEGDNGAFTCVEKPKANCAEGENGCKTCDAGKTKCTQCLDTHEPEYEDDKTTIKQCVEKTKKTCSSFVQNCEECQSDINKCSKCETDFGLRGGVCTKCVENGLRYVNSISPCLPQCPEGCSDCFVENGKAYCESCLSGFHFDEENKACIKNIPEKCAYPIISGCLKCENAESYKCVECDESLNYNLKPNANGECECKENFN